MRRLFLALPAVLLACAAPRTGGLLPSDIRVDRKAPPVATKPGEPPAPADLAEARARRRIEPKLDARFVLAMQDVVRFGKGPANSPLHVQRSGSEWLLSVDGRPLGRVADAADFPALTAALVQAAGGKPEESFATDAPLLFGAALDEALDAANADWAKEFRGREVLAKAAHALVSEVVELDDVFELADALAARAWAFQAMALSAGSGSARDTAALADALGYTRAARQLAAQLPGGDAVALALRHDDAGLQALASNDLAAAEARFYFARAAANGLDPMAVQRARCGPDTPECAAITHVLLQGRVFEGVAIAKESVSWFDLRHLESRCPALNEDDTTLPVTLFDRADALLGRIPERGRVPFDAELERQAHRATLASTAYGRFRFEVRLRSQPKAYGALVEGIGRGGGALADVAAYLAHWFGPASKNAATGVGPQGPAAPAVGVSMRARLLPLANPPTMTPPLPFASFQLVAARADERPAHRKAVADAAWVYSLDPSRIEAARRDWRAVADSPGADVNDLAEHGRWTELEQLAADRAERAVARYRAVQALLENERLTEDAAAAKLREIVDSAPDDRGLLLDFDLFLWRRHRFAEARDVLTAWLAAHPDETSLVTVTIRSRLVRDLTLLGKFAEAEAAAEPALGSGKADLLQELAGLKAAAGAEAAAQEIVDGLRARYGDTQADEAALHVRWIVRDPQGAAAILERMQKRGEYDRGSMRTFLAIFHERPQAEAEEALRAVSRRVSPFVLGLFADELHVWHRDDLAWTLLEGTPSDEPLEYALKHRTLRRAQDSEAARAWAAAHPFPRSLQLEVEERAFAEGNRDLLLDLPDPSDAAEAARLGWWRASALAMARETSGPRFERVRSGLQSLPTTDLRSRAARVLVGLGAAADVVREPVAPAQLPLVAFTLGNLAEREGKLAEAIEWYQDAIEFPYERYGAARFAWERLRAIQRSGKSLERLAAEGLGE